MNRQLVVGVCLFLVSSCGTAEITLEQSAPPVVLHELDIAPGCYVQPNPTVGIPSQPASSSLMAQMAEMHLAMLVQWASLLIDPVLDDPTANEWLVEGVGGRLEGQSLARGDDWGELLMILLSDQSTVRADVHYDPHATVFDIGSQTLTQTAHYVRTTEITLGCDPERRWSFRMLDGRPECWDRFGDPLAPATTPESSREEQEMAMSANMQCLTVVQRLLVTR